MKERRAQRCRVIVFFFFLIKNPIIFCLAPLEKKFLASPLCECKTQRQDVQQLRAQKRSPL